MRVQSDSVVFAYRMDDVFASGGTRYLRDHGPHGLHAAFPGGAADPTPQLDGTISTDGGDYLTLPLRFYSVAPTGAHTWLFSFGSTAVAAAVPRIFSCWNSTGGGVDKGIMLCVDSTSEAQRVRAYQCQGAAAQPYVVSAAASPYVRGYQSAAVLTVETTPRGIHNDAVASYSWGSGAIGTASYDATVVPRIGMDPAATNALTGRGGYVALIDGAVSSADMAELSALMRNATSGTAPWPFCWR